MKEHHDQTSIILRWLLTQLECSASGAAFLGYNGYGDLRVDACLLHNVFHLTSGLVPARRGGRIATPFDVSKVEAFFTRNELGVVELHRDPYGYGTLVVQCSLGNVRW